MSEPVPFQPLLPFEAEDSTSQAPRLIEELARVCREHPLQEKILVAPSLLIGHQLTELLARSGTPWIHLRVETVRTLAHGVVGAQLAREGFTMLSRAQALALVEHACSQTFESGSYFGRLRERPGLHRALQGTIDELRAAGLTPSTLPSSAFLDRRKHRELGEVFRRYATALEAGRYVDGIEVLRRALEAPQVFGRPSDAPEPPTFLLPAATELSALERRFLEKLASGRLVELPAEPPGAWIKRARDTRLFRAIGEENEIREVFRRALDGGIPWDEIEILHTDAAVYPALAWELSREHAIACTFAGGIAVTSTRPGRAAVAYLDWIGQGFAADVLRQALSSGCLTLQRFDAVSRGSGTRGAARALRDAGIGWGRQRHESCLDRLITDLERPEGRSRDASELTEEQHNRRREARSRRLDAARGARDFVRRALELAPPSKPEAGDLRSLARGTRMFVSEFARAADELDGTAQTALETLFTEIESLISLPMAVGTAVERLRDAVAALSVAADRPRPGRVHVAFYRAGGFSGRSHAFLIGLDEARHPGRDLEDPVLLDDERRKINAGLPEPLLALGRERPREAAAALKACVARLPGQLTASYSSFGLRDLSMSGQPAPSPFFLELYRQTCSNPEADYRNLSAALPRAEGFVPQGDRALDDTEWWLSRLSRAGAAAGAGAAAPLVRSFYPWLEDGHRAEAARASDTFTIWDGWIRSGTPQLDPRSGGEPFSASRIQKLAQCPFSYFVRHVLGVQPPEEIQREPTGWLDPKDEGSLLHEVFREFLERITQNGEKPRLDKHLDLIQRIADQRIAAWSERIPPRGDLALCERRKTIFFACRTFLRLEEEHCRGVTPRFFEVPFGLSREAATSAAAVASAEPVVLDAGDRGFFRLRGSIDRVDEAPDGTFHVWDYKTGSAWNVTEGAGLRGGRQIQPMLYAMAFEALLERAGTGGKVSRSGYFFPGRKGEGQRMVTPLDPEGTRDILRRLFDLVSGGFFPHAVSEQDCRYCDFEAICGGAERASRQAELKLRRTDHAVLAAFREIHAEE